MTKTTLNTKKIIIDILNEHQAIDITAIDIKKHTDIADYMIICSGNASTHVKALADHVVMGLKAKKISIIGVEGKETREWILIDTGDIIVHIMLPTIREFYSLEKLWGLKTITRKKTPKE